VGWQFWGLIGNVHGFECMNSVLVVLFINVKTVVVLIGDMMWINFVNYSAALAFDCRACSVELANKKVLLMLAHCY
jgi:hypothetical protein